VGGDPGPAERIQRLRTRLGLSQEQLARQLGVSFATVNRWESGRTQMSARASRALAEFEVRAAAEGPPTAGLPVAQSSFIGRPTELTELGEIIKTSRLVSLVGPGGAGKTRLAIEAIRRASPAAPWNPRWLKAPFLRHGALAPLAQRPPRHTSRRTGRVPTAPAGAVISSAQLSSISGKARWRRGGMR
jgi:transcriptional regulator with XRE-family HTH domain